MYFFVFPSLFVIVFIDVLHFTTQEVLNGSPCLNRSGGTVSVADLRTFAIS